MRVRVLSYNWGQNFYRCIDGMGQEHNIDLTTDASFPEIDVGENPEKIIGMELEIGETWPYLLFGKNIKIIKRDLGTL